MAKLIITDENRKETVVNGRMSFKVSKAIDENGEEITVCQGQMMTHKYFEEITKIETDRFVLEDIEVTDETFGTNDFNILYEFEVHNDSWKIKEDYLDEDAIKTIEEDEYKDDEGDYYMKVQRGVR